MDPRASAMLGVGCDVDGPVIPPCGADSQDPAAAQHFSVTEADFSQGHLKLKIGVQAKRTKKPPKNLENYVCRPAIKTSIRQTRRVPKGRKMAEDRSDQVSPAEAPSSGGSAETLSTTSDPEIPELQKSPSGHSRDPEMTERPPVTGTSASVTEKLAQLIATCPPSKSSKTRATKPPTSCPVSAEMDPDPAQRSGSPVPAGAGSDDGHSLAKESVLEKFCIARDAAGGEERSAVPEVDNPGKLSPVYCTSLDYRDGGASDASAAVGEGNLPSPAPQSSLTSSCPRSPSLHFSPALVECTHETGDPVPGAQHILDFSQNHTRTRLPSGACALGKKPTQRVQPGCHKPDSSVVSFASLLRKKQLIAGGSLTEKTFHSVKHGGTIAQTRPFVQRKGKRPRWTRGPLKATPSSKEGAEQYGPENCAPPSALSTPSTSTQGPAKESHRALPKLYSSLRTYRMLGPSRDLKGKQKVPGMPHLEGPPKRALTIPAFKVAALESKEDPGPPVLQPEVELPSLQSPLPRPLFPRKRGRPRRDSLPQMRAPPVLSVAPFLVTDSHERRQSNDLCHGKLHAADEPHKAPAHGSDPERRSRKRHNGQMVKSIIRKINKMKTMKRKKLLNQILSGTAEPSGRVPAKPPASGLAASFRSRLGQQINVSKKGTIYIGKRRGRKPKASHDCAPSRTPANEPLSSPALSSPIGSLSCGVSGAQSPLSSDASFVEPSPVPYLHLHPRHGSFLQTLAMRKALKDSRQLSPPPHCHEIPSLKDATSSPVSESHSDETIPSDSGIGTDNNSTSDRAEKFCAQRKHRHSFEHLSLLAPEAAVAMIPLKHKCKHRSCDKRQKRKRKKKFPQLRRRQDPDFLAELEEIVTRLSEVHVSHRSRHFIPQDPLPTIFRLNFSSFYGHPGFPPEPLRYIRKPELKKKRGRPPKLRDAMAEVPFVHSLEFPLSGSGFYPSYGVPYSPSPLTATPIGLSYYGRYPPALYPPL